MGAVLILDATLSLGRSHITGWVGARTQHYLASLAMERLFNADLRSYEAVAPGVHMQRLRAVDSIRNFYAGQALLLLVDLPFAGLFLVLIALIAGELALVPLGILTLLAIFAGISGRDLSRALNYRAVGDERRHNFMIEILSNIHTIKALGMEALMVRRHERLQAGSSQASYLVSLAGATARNMGLTLSQVTAVGVGAYGSTMVMSGELTVGGLAASTLLASRAAQPLLRSLGIWTQFQNAHVARGQVGELFALPQDIKPEVPTETTIEGQVSMTDLDFGYSEDADLLLRNINLQIECGDVVGFSGTNGSGKSTVLGLVMGALASSGGRLQIDNNDIWQIDPKALRRQVCYLPQNGVLFQGTIMDNLTMFSGQRYIDRAMYFADRLGLHEAVGKMPKGYDTQVEYRTTTRLPGGSRLEIVAPVRGIVQELAANTVGGVIAPGAPIAMVVPVEDELIVEARISPIDVGHVKIGDKATVKITTYDFARLGAIDGVVEKISPTTFKDQDGTVYYLATLRLAKNHVGEHPDGNLILPGMVAEVDIMAGERTILRYLLRPIYQSLDAAMTER